jgi:5-methylcytosine-specific restriction endonuclease McrA
MVSGKDNSDSYREQALKLFPWVCARCGRDFTGKQLRELTVHHRDHDHSNNPPDGSNWELLCVYCHDNEHQRFLEADARGPLRTEEGQASTYKALAGLGAMLKKPENKS